VSRQSFEVVRRSPAAPEAVFAVLADGSRWSEWAGPLVRRSAWDREGAPEPGGVGAVRRLGSAPFFSREKIVEYDPPRHLAYVLLSGMPVRDYRSDVDLTPDGAGTEIRWRSSFAPRIPGTGPLVRAVMAAIVGGFARRLAKAATR
jgi:uncharacterized protein YndB with AHSA1/START domain